MHKYFTTVIEPLNENLRRSLGIKTIVVKYEDEPQAVYVKTTGEVYAESAAFDNRMDELGV